MANGSRKRTYLASIYLWIGLALAFSLVLFTLLADSAIRNTVRENLLESDRKVFAQIQYNVESMDTILRNLNTGIFASADAGYLMYAAEPDIFEATVRLDRMKRSILAVYPFVHSFEIYNQKAGVLYSSFSGMFTPDPYLEERIGSKEPIPILVPIFRLYDNRTLNPSDRYDRVFTYAIYDSTAGDGVYSGAFFLNVRESWVVGNLRRIESATPDQEARTLLFDDSGTLLIDTGRSAVDVSVWEGLNRDWIRPAIAQGATSGSLTRNLDGEAYFINYTRIPEAGWTIARLQSYRATYRHLDRIRAILLLLSGAVLLLSLFLAYAISMRIYRPVGRLVRQIERSDAASLASPQEGEIEFLSHAYERAVDQARQAFHRNETTRSVLRQYRFRKLLADSASLTPEDLKDEAGAPAFAFDPHRPVALCLFRFDDAHAFQERHDAKDRELYRFILGNIAGEVLGERYPVELGATEEDHAVAIVNPSGTSCPPDEIDPLLSRIQRHMMEFFGLSVSVAVSGTGSGFRDLTALHLEARRFIEYRFFAGRSALIHPEDYRANEANDDAGYSVTLDRRLAEAIRRQDLRDVDAVLDRIMGELRVHRIEQASFSIPRLLGVIRSAIAEMNRDRVQPIVAEFAPLQRLLSTIETIDGIRESLSAFLHELLSRKPDRSVNRNRIVSDTVLEIVTKNHADPNLSLQQIASLMRMSADYVGRIFREDRGFSVAEAINAYRIEKAAEWLRNSDLEVRQIMGRVGIDNESHFYRQFKARYSVTPREYALRMRRGS